ncbi:MAG TPA: SH3 domain-containing protein [Chloroflexota bacterium]|nr:SH3 domain-containing protein [Chloroflexota bacterium]
MSTLPVAHAGDVRRARVARLAVEPLPPTPMWTRFWQVRVRSTPGGPLLSNLDIDQEVRATGATAIDGVRWLRVQLWGALDGWIRADLLAPTPIVPTPGPPGVPVAPHPVGPHAPMPVHADGVADGEARLRTQPDSGASLLQILPSGTPLHVKAWVTDSTGQAWYRTSAPVEGWVSADHVNLDRGTPLPNLAAVQGLGMWCTPPVLDAAPPQALVSAAVANHITHIYVEVAGSHDGFWGKQTLDTLLPVAHAAHIAVIAWVYPFLDDLPLDVEQSVQVARYVAPSGDRPDGLMADVEQNMQEPYVRAYSQVVRARLGPRVLMGIATYPPQSYWGARYPFRTVARSWDVIVPMDYWHLSPRPYAAAEAADYVTASIAGIRQAVGSQTVPIEVLGQMFDFYQTGLNSPTMAEVEAAINAAIAGDAIGVSFFEWNHATPGEWDALGAWHEPDPGVQKAATEVAAQ